MTTRTEYYVMEVLDESSSEFPKQYDWDNKFSQSNFRKYYQTNRRFPDFEPILDQEIYNDPNYNKVNDFILSPIIKYCVSEKVKNILSKFNLPQHKYYKVNVYRYEHKMKFIKRRTKLDINYYALFYDQFYLEDNLDKIDLSKTKFIEIRDDKEQRSIEFYDSEQIRQIRKTNSEITQRLNQIINPVSIKPYPGTESEYVHLKDKRIGEIKTDIIYLNDSFDFSVDLFEIPQFSWMTYISERLMNEFNDNKVTGLIFSKPGERQYKVTRPNPKLIWDI